MAEDTKLEGTQEAQPINQKKVSAPVAPKKSDAKAADTKAAEQKAAPKAEEKAAEAKAKKAPEKYIVVSHFRDRDNFSKAYEEDEEFTHSDKNLIENLLERKLIKKA